MASTWLTIRAFDLGGIIDLGQEDDPRVGSGRKDSDGGGTISGNSGNKGSSLSKLGATFIPISIYVFICIVLFFILRRRMHRVYAPRCIPGLRAPELPIPALPDGWFNWIVPFFKTPDTVVLNHGSLDGFFFLRYLKVLRNICFAGCLISWPILFPIHATGGRGQKELELLTLGNVANPQKLYAHAFVAWLLFGFVLFTVARECIYYINLRQAYLSSPYYSTRLSSRTVLFTSIPHRYQDEARIRKLYGDSVRRVWILRTSKGLVNLIQERQQTALRLEKAELELIKKANVIRRKQLRANPGSSTAFTSQDQLAKEESSGADTQLSNGDLTTRSNSAKSSGFFDPQDIERRQWIAQTVAALDSTKLLADPKDQDPNTDYIHPYGLSPTLPDVRGSVAAQYLPAEARPHHRPIGNLGRRVDTIRWTRLRLTELNKQISKLRKRLRRGGKDSETLPAVFVEFDTQEAAQAAHQILAHHQPLHMAPRLLGIRPDEIVWSALRMKWLERIVRRFAILGLIVAAIIFWSIPSAIVGVVSNIEALSERIVFLNWIGSLPGPIKGFLTGFVPAIALSMFMALVPGMLRFCAIAAGVPSYNMVELFTQTAYFAFQVVQVFLITTLTSAASTAFFDVLMDPMKAKDLLAQNLPTASNFYLSYILIQCLANAGTAILQPFDALRHAILGRVAQLPRTHYRLWRTMRAPRWGRDFPVFANLGVIALSYACIAPLILIFAGMGMWFTHIVWRYNLIFVLDSDPDSKGLFYPRALMHLTVGLYLAEICLIGLFFLNGAIGPGLLLILLLVFTALVHYSIYRAMSPLIHNLPQTMSLEEDIQEEEKAKLEAARARTETDTFDQGAANAYYDMDQEFGDPEDDIGPLSDDEDHTQGTRALEGASDVRSAFGSWFKDYTKTAAKEQVESLGLTPTPHDPDAPPNFITKWLNPHIHEDFVSIRKTLMTLPETLPDEGHDPRRTYYPPEMWAPKPIIWIPRDEAKVSRQEVAHTRKATPISDLGATLDENGRVVVEVGMAPLDLPRLLL